MCGSDRLRIVVRRDRSRKGRTAASGIRYRLRICRDCGHLANPDNTFDYAAFDSLTALPDRARIGTLTRPGREFHMARMAIEILGRSDLDVLVFGAGRSFDNVHIAGLPEVRNVAIADIMQLRDDAEFIDANLPAPRTFTVVIASEVVEHFQTPRADFEHLFGYVEADGLLVCSTNLYDHGRLGKQHYLYLNGHVSYYTVESARWLADANGFHLDIRTPLVATGYGGRRKRYLLFTRSAKVVEAIAEYFRSREYAPSESPTADIELAQARLAAEEDVASSPPDPPRPAD